MTTPVSPLATVRDALLRAPSTASGRRLADRALAALDSLDGTITLSREEAGYCYTAAVRADDNALAALLAARIEAAK